MLGPKNSKFRKSFKGRIHGNAHSGCELNVGTYGLKALEPERINGAQLEAARRAVTRALRRMGRVIFRFVPDIPITRKPQEVRMGGGKGNFEHHIFRVHPGRILIEVDGVNEAMAHQALALAQAKLPIATRIVTRLWE